jgi:hypothetical protein
MDSKLTTFNVRTEANFTQADIREEIVQGRIKAWEEREAQKRREYMLDPAILNAIDSVGDRPRKNVGRRKPKSAQNKPESLPDEVEYIRIYSHHHRNREFSWIDIAILSELDFFMQDTKKACFAGMKHLAAVGRVVRGTAHNHVTSLERDGVVIDLGYYGKSKRRIVAPQYSAFPEISRRILNEYENAKKDDGIPF